MPGRRWQAPKPAGAHFLADHNLIAELVAASGTVADRLVVDLGAGYGALTAPLTATGAQVLAIELDARLAGRLRRRFAGNSRVRVVEADLGDVALPRRPFWVVANPPFSLTTTLCRRLLGELDISLQGAELILQWAAARRLVARRPRDAETAWWVGRYEARVVRRVSPGSFRPPPRVDAAHVSIRPRAITGSRAGQAMLRALVRHAYTHPSARLDAVVLAALVPLAPRATSRAVRRALVGAGVDPELSATGLSGQQWHRIAISTCSMGRRQPCVAAAASTVLRQPDQTTVRALAVSDEFGAVSSGNDVTRSLTGER